ncbi:MAG TPA: 50S ribosomal protein L20, partial [Candidatus Woesebacteria bacterium]|nr:50S ribosomal protein L20 [Candidatus Woesebacteria bacterium]
LMAGLTRNKIELNRKMLDDLVVNDLDAFKEIVAQANKTK